MVQFPFQLSIKNNLENCREESVRCTALLRAIKGRRKVYDALWNGRVVILKVFSDRISGRCHLKREWQVMKILQERGLNSPEPLFYGRTDGGRWAMVMEKLIDGETALEAVVDAGSGAEKLNILINVCRELAGQNSRGVLQRDLYLGNFLISSNNVFALDAGQMRILRREAGKKRSMRQLAVLGCSFDESDTEGIGELYREYHLCRGWEFSKKDEESLGKLVRKYRQKAIRKKLKKSLRTGKRHLRIKGDGYSAVFDKEFCEGVEPADFIRQIDALMDRGQILKRGRTCYLSRVCWNNKDVVVKRYNHKGFFHSVRQTIKLSRARRRWLNGQRSGMLNIATPKPVAFIERLKGLIIWNSYLVTEYVEGQKISRSMKDNIVG
jgi:tRNA A-37 threonylcarbamoyl transferase component Bud32